MTKKIAAVILALAVVAGFLFVQVRSVQKNWKEAETEGWENAPSRSFHLQEGQAYMWSISAKQQVHAKIKIKIKTVSVQDEAGATFFIKGSGFSGGKTLDAGQIAKKKKTSLTITLDEGDTNYVLLEQIGCSSMNVEVTVKAGVFKKYLQGLGVEKNKDYGVSWEEKKSLRNGLEFF